MWIKIPKVIPEYKEKAKQRIIEEGAIVFMERGYYKTKMDDIAEALGVSKGAIYQYFRSKEQLFFDVMEYILQYRKDELISIILSDKPMRIATSEFFEMKISRSFQTRTLGFDLFFEAARNEKLRERMTDIYEKAYSEFLSHIENLKTKGVIKKTADVGVIWRGLVALRDGLISSILLGANVSDAKKTWERVATILLREVLAE